MGTPFYRSFEIAHDLGGQKIGFRNSGSSASVSVGASLASGAIYMTFNMVIVGALCIWTALF